MKTSTTSRINDGSITLKNGEWTLKVRQREADEDNPLTYEVTGRNARGNSTSHCDSYGNGMIITSLIDALKYAESTFKSLNDPFYW
jgi:hypothetical protein